MRQKVKMSRRVYTYYSVDASIMVKIKDSFYEDVAQSVWDELVRLVEEDRWKIFDLVAKEVHGNRADEWFKRNPKAIIQFDSIFNDYFNRFMVELEYYGLKMFDPNKEKDARDPFVVALALMLEKRSISNLRIRTGNVICCVLTNEVLKEDKTNIPSVCAHYNLPCMNLLDFMRHHGWKLSLTVKNPE